MKGRRRVRGRMETRALRVTKHASNLVETINVMSNKVMKASKGVGGVAGRR